MSDTTITTAEKVKNPNGFNDYLSANLDYI